MPIKTWKTHYSEQVGRPDMGWNVELSEHEYQDHIQEIQLESMKEGMRRAAAICDGNPDWVPADNDECKSAILSEAEKLTQENL